MTLLSVTAFFCPPWGLIGRGGKARVTAASTATPSHLDLGTLLSEVPEKLSTLGVEHHGTHGHGKMEILAALACSPRTFAMGAALCLEKRVVTVLNERVLMGLGDEPDRATVTPIAAVGPPTGNKFLAAEAHDPAAAVSSPDLDSHLVDEHGPGFLLQQTLALLEERRDGGLCDYWLEPGGRTLMNRPR
jgi:hypothetical protein